MGSDWIRVTPSEQSASDDDSRVARSGRVPGRLRAVRRGATGGLIATAVMTIYRLPVFRAVPPTAEFWARFLGRGDAEQYTGRGIILHFAYGTFAGAVFGPLFGEAARRSTVPREYLGVVSGLVYGVTLSLFGTQVVFRHLLDRDLEPEHELVFHVGHVIYGLTLGTWLSTREPLGEVYESADRQ